MARARSAAPAARFDTVDVGDRAAADTATLRLWLGTVAEITRLSTQSFDLAELLDLIAEGVCRLTGQHGCAVLIAHPDVDQLTIEGWHGLSDDYVERVNTTLTIRIRPGRFSEGPSARAYRSQQPVQIRDTSVDESFGPWQDTASEFGYRAVLAVPLIASGGAVGSLTTYSYEPHDFSSDEVSLLETLANLAAIAIDMAALREQGRQTIAGLEAAKAELEKVKDVLESSHEIHGELMQVVLADTATDVILNALSAALRCHARLEDLSGTTIALADELPARFEQDVLVANPEVMVDVRERAWASKAPERWTVGERQGILLPITVAGEPTAQLWLEHLVDGGLEVDLMTVERVGAVIAFQLLKERSADEVEARLARDLLGDLLIVDDPDEYAALGQRAAHLGHDLTRRHVLLVLRADTGRESPPHPESTPRASHQRMLSYVRTMAGSPSSGRALVSARADEVVVLWPEHGGIEDAESFARRVQRGATEQLDGRTVSVAIGGSCDQMGDHALAFQLGHGALQLASDPGRLITPAQLGVYRFLLQVRRPAELLEFSRQLLEPLREYDNRKGPVLMQTLETFFATANSVTETAKRLHVHPNTVNYRLRKIESLGERDLNRTSDLLDIQLALKVAEVFGA